ncbi:hypothetical protein MVLG_06336 [Microbotryum lychnidis-dioicae p1A1 Lamole]|uniref:Protein CPL1-like domain-containing protein n=1 Tax=Microbotryum lychnidis-dioicae (strain p1A1 Lamole / MvSl-1064) TaxID=683840 RepID=U5HGZ1_USTV1|nr:hypothetical protein MVLG_06336 [Microbotryum lychnidis-dioicae p1A1 Lamole]|eukprot:KDE03139.1 hypothetical protein MVLG_06336 [Microbotryum lychnidis-dioicae p1A1 Lamole]
MRFSTFSSVFAIGTALLAARASAEPHPDTPTSPNTYPHTSLSKRACIFGICIFGGSSYNLDSDPNNCGSIGNNCQRYSFLNAGSGGAICSNGVCGPASCNWLFDFNWLTKQCQNVGSDVNNCGRCGQTCSITGASGTQCQQGTCIATDCNQGYLLSAGKCTKVYDTQNDVNNCGSVGNVCKLYYPGGSGSSCVAGQCQAASCNNGGIWNPSSMACQNCNSDVNNCGAIGKVCSFPRGTAQCQSGNCVLTGCNSGSYMVGGQCVALSLSTDTNNCGAVGNVCNFANGAGSCSNGKCVISTCSTNYAKATDGSGNAFCQWVNTQSDPNNCGTAGNKCPSLLNAASTTCTSGKCGATCNNGYDWDSGMSFCRPVTSDPNNCGRYGNTCKITNGIASCVNGACTVQTCNYGYSNVNGVCTAVNTENDKNNCGFVGNVCLPSYPLGSGSVCLNGACRPASCNTGTTWNPATMACQNTDSDILNCGKVGNVCTFPRGVARCQSGNCVLTGCLAGSYMVGGQCVALDLTSDDKNCGSVGNVCSFPNGAGSCVANQCKLTSCNAGFALMTTGGSFFSAPTSSCVAVDTQTDINNCGTVGNKCYSFANSVGTSCVAGKCQGSCFSGFAWDSSASRCRAVLNDVNNCGSIGNVCDIPNGRAMCLSGSCQPLSCNFGYYNLDGACASLDLQTDVNNCGLPGLRCPTSFLFGTGVTCVGGICRPNSCKNGYDWDILHLFCRDVSDDMNNCGRCGSVCTIANGVGQCSGGSCSVKSCNSGFQNVNGVCTSMNLQTDVNNCGSVGNVCSFPNGQGTCQNGKCTFTGCNSDCALVNNACIKADLTSDVNNCGSIGNVCRSYANGGNSFCSNSVCQTKCNAGFDFDFSAKFCRDIRTDTSHCGGCNNNCLAQLPGASLASCVSGTCYAKGCNRGYTLTSGKCISIDTQNDPNNCGGIGKCCEFAPRGATGTCTLGVCTITSCPAGYTISNNLCLQSGPSQRAANVKKRKIEKPKSLCPENETACPIVGSSSYALAVDQHFSSFADVATGGIMGGNGGYECLDTRQALDSCGGCASTGEGQDCTKIRGAVGVGCDAGACVVFSCQSGWKPNLAASKCVRSHSHGHNSSSEDASHSDDEESSSAAARRHIHAQAHHGHIRSHHGHV